MARTANQASPTQWSSSTGRDTIVGMDARNLTSAFASFDEQWQPKRIARINDYEVKVAKVEGEFVWHTHDETDELFLVHAGHLTIQLRDRDVELGPGEMFVVPRGVEHCPKADVVTQIVLFEPTGTVNTGDTGGSRTAVVEDLG
ncbi:MAG: cupin protein [Aeromicrobium sp.]|nr:cupin protein [Aeromicrobium sp.]